MKNTKTSRAMQYAELIKMAMDYTKINKKRFRSPEDVIDFMRPLFDSNYEQFYIMYLDVKNQLIAEPHLHSKGTTNQTGIYLDRLLREALIAGATSIILVHNHPSGDPTPSREDIEVSRRIKLATDFFDLTIQDSVIVGATGGVSLRGRGLLNFAKKDVNL